MYVKIFNFLNKNREIASGKRLALANIYLKKFDIYFKIAIIMIFMNSVYIRALQKTREGSPTLYIPLALKGL